MGSVAHKALYLLGSRESFLRDKVCGMSISPFTSLGDDKNAWMYTSIPSYTFMTCW
jgi:hypothetical protein